ncbi:hypothetical protein CEXT_606571 [Caerostris extrusa]|uniref:Uncharacterized protein n=1 Tax=Caerostris extrusa TaxID=172846 RepID=A0AAV4UMT4_CAEEX|nr:hypothetical protein CEXT_606571 [Caerostris extrusa]
MVPWSSRLEIDHRAHHLILVEGTKRRERPANRFSRKRSKGSTDADLLARTESDGHSSGRLLRHSADEDD